MTDGSLLASLRSVLGYAALASAASVFLPGHAQVTAVLAILVIFMGWGTLRPIARVIGSLVLFVLILAWLFDAQVLISAFGGMSAITGLVLSVMFLSAVLGRSQDLEVISRSLFRGRSMGRYLGLSVGTSTLSVPLNFGSIGLVAPMIGTQIRDGGESVATRNAARAVIRGFGASPMGSPLSVAVVMTVTLLPGLESWSLLAWSVPFALAYLFAGACFRENEHTGHTGSFAPVNAPEDRAQVVGSWLRFLGLAVLISLSAFTLNARFGFRYSQAVTVSCLAVAVLILLKRRLGRAGTTLPSMANVSNELAIMGGASFLGGALAATAMNSLGSDFSLPGAAYPVIALCVPWLFYLGGTVGVNPIVSATVVGGILGPVWPPEAFVGLGLAMVTGWGITIAGTPYSANALLLERFTGYGARRAAYGWNLQYSMLFLGLSGCLCAALVYSAL
ncbi:hypothetical protein KUV44_01820 [Marinobacter daepoensis]|uniref:Uncharacterized protein n=1 Tax=Marinobacter daepoensis TaxID=262077 RepID=A0ABS3BCA7_9GAMM|nr:hypothetical protein [Marinobacter daepoensis]MBN7769183.1 hypothetical protein [Marinobacter daepoensis]MBY6077873.1 hypothetical protein [Marinobacter daepoensis]